MIRIKILDEKDPTDCEECCMEKSSVELSIAGYAIELCSECLEKLGDKSCNQMFDIKVREKVKEIMKTMTVFPVC